MSSEMAKKKQKERKENQVAERRNKWCQTHGESINLILNNKSHENELEIMELGQ